MKLNSFKMLNQPQSYMEIFASTDEFREALATQILNAGGLNSVEFILWNIGFLLHFRLTIIFEITFLHK